MPSPSLIPPLNVIAAPVPPLEVAAAQLRAINHRLLHGVPDPHGHLMEALTGEDFLATEHDGAWHDRADFLARVRQQTPVTGASCEDMRVRLFGPVAVVHAVFGAAHGTASKVRYTDVHVWSGAAWRLVSVQNTLLQDGVAVQAHTGPAPGHWRALRAAHCGAMSLGSGPAPHAPWCGQDPGGDDLAVLRMLNENYVQAFRQADVAWYDAHLAPDYVVVSGSGLFQDRGAALADFAKPYFATSIASFPVGKVNIRRFADVALVHAENDYQLKDGRAGVSRYTDIWHKHKHQGRWRCVAAHITVHKAVHKAPAM